MASGRCGGDFSRMVRERTFDFFNGSAGEDVGFTHPVILQGNLPFDRDEEWTRRGYERVSASPFDPKHIRASAATCEPRAGVAGFGPQSHVDRAMPFSIVDRVEVPNSNDLN